MVDQYLRVGRTYKPPLMYDEQNSSITTTCNHCQTKIAEIFQDDGDFCLNCWQERTYPNI
jgi:hypothetical protein